MPLLIVIIILLLIWGNISRRSASHPLNTVAMHTPPTIVCGINSGGDNFTGGNSIVSGVCEPHSLHCNVAPIIPIHITMPVDPPPIAIQKKTTIYTEGTLLRSINIGMMQNGKLRQFPDWNTFISMGYNINNAIPISTASYNAIPRGTDFPVILAKRTTPVKINPIIPVRNQPYQWCGNGPGWCISKLDQLANQHCHLGCGCGAF